MILHFVKQFKLPWILKWQYVVGDNVERHWFVKWWDRYNIDPVIQKVKLMIQAPKAQNLPLPSIIPQKLLTPNDVSQPYMNAAPNVSTANSSSSKKQSSKEKKKKALLKAMALLDSLNGSDGDDDDDSNASSTVPNPQRQLFGNLGFDS